MVVVVAVAVAVVVVDVVVGDDTASVVDDIAVITVVDIEIDMFNAVVVM